jgi:hypothetical protein
LLLTQMPDNHRRASEDVKQWDINPVTPDEMLGYLRAYKARAGVVLDASEIAKHI